MEGIRCKVLIGKWECPWNIAVEVDQIMEMMKAKNIHIQHIMREGNKLSDHIANLALDTGGCKYHHFREMDSEGRKIINADKSKFHHIRVSSTKGRWEDQRVNILQEKSDGMTNGKRSFD
ncbi:hypothetical protein KY289_008470 [Solanum tuberosum]|nr:hypothetical protein KY289_008470 [Solanum tuberosum]